MKKTIIAASLASLGLSFSALAGNKDVQVQINLPVQQSASEDVVVNVTFSNNGRGAAKILKWYTPMSDIGVEEHMFKVTRNGEEVPYLGAHYKRPAPQSKDFFILKQGDSITVPVELSQVYDLSQGGDYSIQYDVESFNLFENNGNGKGNKKQEWGTLTSNVAFTYIEAKAGGNGGGKGKPDKGDGNGGTGEGGVSFTGRCSNQEQSAILSALGSAGTMANDSVAYLNTGSAGPRYTTWFGDYTSSRYNTVASNFDKIKDAIDTKPLTFDCSCNQNYFAYVYPSQPYKVYLCKAFWSARETGTDSRAGTIIHELSHFNVVAGTDDLAYGQTNAKNLALSNPSKAIQNADSHEYFAENTPKQN